MKQKKLQVRLKEHREARNAPDLVVQRDWVQVHLLAGFARSPALSSTLVFKGGTALQKIFFGEAYRFSEDLDFTGLAGAPQGDVLLQALGEICADVAKVVSDRLGEPLQLAARRYQDQLDRQESFKIDFTMPWQDKANGHVKVEITFDEPVLLDTARRPLLVQYDDVECEVLCYSLEEIVLEKMRGAQQTLQRSREKLDAKCSARGVSIKSIDDVFVPEILAKVREQWVGQLKDFVPGELPDVERVLIELKPKLARALGWA